MNIKNFLLFGVALLVCESVCGQSLPTDETELWNLSVRNKDRLLSYLEPILKNSGRAGRLYIRSKCLGKSENLLFFPSIEIDSRPNGDVGPDAVRHVFAKREGVTVAERQLGLIGIWIGSVNNDLLRTKIHVLKLKPRARYNYQDAIVAILSTREVQTKMRQLQMEVFNTVVHYPISNPDPKLPHLPASMDDLTMDEALDRVAQTFGGLVMYEECEGQNRRRLFYVHMREI